MGNSRDDPGRARIRDGGRLRTHAQAVKPDLRLGICRDEEAGWCGSRLAELGTSDEVTVCEGGKGGKRELLRRLETYSDVLATTCDRPVASVQTSDLEAHLREAQSP